MLTHPSFSPPFRRVLLASLVALVALLVWDRTRRPAFHGPRILRAMPGETNADWCAARCETLAGVRCYDEAQLCRQYLPGVKECTTTHLQTQPWVVWRYQCFATPLTRANAGSAMTAAVPQACFFQCF